MTAATCWSTELFLMPLCHLTNLLYSTSNMANLLETTAYVGRKKITLNVFYVVENGVTHDAFFALSSKHILHFGKKSSSWNYNNKLKEALELNSTDV